MDRSKQEDGDLFDHPESQQQPSTSSSQPLKLWKDVRDIVENLVHQVSILSEHRALMLEEETEAETENVQYYINRRSAELHQDVKIWNRLKKKKAAKDEKKAKLRAAEEGENEIQCSICLCSSALDDPSFTDGCSHRFCFICIDSWSKVKSRCPMCKKHFKVIFHKLNEKGRPTEEYAVKKVDQDYNIVCPLSLSDIPILGSLSGERLLLFDHIMRLQLDIRQSFRSAATSNVLGLDRVDRNRPWASTRRSTTVIRNSSDLTRHIDRERVDRIRTRAANTLRFISLLEDSARLPRHQFLGSPFFRQFVYDRGLRVRPLEEVTNLEDRRVRPCDHKFFDRHERMTHRLMPFLALDLNALCSQDQYMVTSVSCRVMGMLNRFDIISAEFRDRLEEFLGDKTDHFCHELYHFARSPHSGLQTYFFFGAVYHHDQGSWPLNILHSEDSVQTSSEGRQPRRDRTIPTSTSIAQELIDSPPAPARAPSSQQPIEPSASTSTEGQQGDDDYADMTQLLPLTFRAAADEALTSSAAADEDDDDKDEGGSNEDSSNPTINEYVTNVPSTEYVTNVEQEEVHAGSTANRQNEEEEEEEEEEEVDTDYVLTQEMLNPRSRRNIRASNERQSTTGHPYSWNFTTEILPLFNITADDIELSVRNGETLINVRPTHPASLRLSRALYPYSILPEWAQEQFIGMTPDGDVQDFSSPLITMEARRRRIREAQLLRVRLNVFDARNRAEAAAAAAATTSFSSSNNNNVGQREGEGETRRQADTNAIVGSSEENNETSTNRDNMTVTDDVSDDDDSSSSMSSNVTDINDDKDDDSVVDITEGMTWTSGGVTPPRTSKGTSATTTTTTRRQTAKRKTRKKLKTLSPDMPSSWSTMDDYDDDYSFAALSSTYDTDSSPRKMPATTRETGRKQSETNQKDGKESDSHPQNYRKESKQNRKDRKEAETKQKGRKETKTNQKDRKESKPNQKVRKERQTARKGCKRNHNANRRMGLERQILAKKLKHLRETPIVTDFLTHAIFTNLNTINADPDPLPTVDSQAKIQPTKPQQNLVTQPVPNPIERTKNSNVDSDNAEGPDLQIICEMKPRRLRTPPIVNLDIDDMIMDGSDAMDSADDGEETTFGKWSSDDESGDDERERQKHDQNERKQEISMREIAEIGQDC